MALRDYLVGRLPQVMLVLVGPVDEILAFVVVEVSHEGRVPLPVQIEFGQNLRSFLWERRVSKKSPKNRLHYLFGNSPQASHEDYCLQPLRSFELLRAADLVWASASLKQ